MNNNTYYQNTNYSNIPFNNIDFQTKSNYNNVRNNILDDDYIDGIISKNKGKRAKFYITIPGSISWQDKIFEGIIEHVGRDYISLSNPSNGESYLIPVVYLGYVSFDDVINYD